MAVNEVVVKSSIVSAMGAKISLAGPGRGMYLIIGHGLLPEALVKRAGGEIVIRLNGRKMLVTLPFSGYLSLRSCPEVSHIGPVTVDMKRLARVAEMLTKTSGPAPGSSR